MNFEKTNICFETEGVLSAKKQVAEKARIRYAGEKESVRF